MTQAAFTPKASLRNRRYSTSAKRLLGLHGPVGNITRAAANPGISRDCHYVWLDADPTYSERFREAQAKFGDRLHGKFTDTLFAASNEAVVNHPVAFLAELHRWFPDHYGRDNQVTVNVDARTAIAVTDWQGLLGAAKEHRRLIDHGEDDRSEPPVIGGDNAP